MKYLIDTNIVSELISKNPNEQVLEFISATDESLLNLSVITLGEIKFGIEKMDDSSRKEEISLWFSNKLIPRFSNRIVYITDKTMLVWGEVFAELSKNGRNLPIMDSLIGATCICHNMTLITRNEKDFEGLNIELINPFEL